MQAISLASVILSYTRGRAAGRQRVRARLEQAETEISLLREELRIKDGRWERSRSRRRPDYTPTQRMRILQLRAARGWTLEQTARVFLIDLQTLLHWTRRIDEPAERPLVQTAVRNTIALSAGSRRPWTAAWRSSSSEPAWDVPTVRCRGEILACRANVRLMRINLHHPEGPEGIISLPGRALDITRVIDGIFEAPDPTYFSPR